MVVGVEQEDGLEQEDGVFNYSHGSGTSSPSH